MNSFRFSFGTIISLLFIICIIITAVFPDFFSNHSAIEPSGASLESPGKSHWFGTDDLGIDLWAQICNGSRISLIIGLGTAFFAGIGGSIIGIISGYSGGKVDKVVMRVADMIIALPDIPLIIVLATFIGPGVIQIVIVLSFLTWTGIARIVRSKVLSLKEETFIKASKSYGAGLKHIIFRHCFPAIFPLVIVCSLRTISRAVVAEASLSFLGLGDPTSKSWGLILHHAINFRGIYFTEFWKWWVTVPVFMIIFFVLSVAIVTKKVEMAFNTKRFI